MSGPQYFGRKAINTIRIGLGISSAVAFAFGILMLCFTGAAADVLGIFLGISVLVSGLVYAGIGIFAKDISPWSRVVQILLGVVMVIAGVISTQHPAIGIWVLTFAVGFSWIFEGVVSLAALGFTAGSPWNIVYGIISIIAGILLVVMPFSSTYVLIVFGGISLIVIGCVGLFRSFSIGKTA